MKKTTRIICIALVLTMIIATLTACNVTIDSMTIKSLGNVKNEYVKDSVIDTTGLTVEVTYNDGSTKVVSESDLTITKPSTTTAGNVKLKIAYEGKEIEVGIAIVDTIDGTYTITEFSAPAFVSLYKSNTKSSSPTGKEYFKKNTDGYKVGAQNEFKFLPIIKALDENKKPISVTAYKSVSKIFLDDAELTGDMLAKYVVIDNNLSTYKFTNDAVGKTFKLSVKPFYQQDMKAVEFTFEVINGWNCYNIADLSMIDNSKVGEVGTWDAIKSSKGLPTDVVATGIVMHSNIVVKDTDLPIEFFVNKN
ncbi:MAG: bacterial Ig-like domain-containing protein, partial [Clostridia bacterium]